MAGRRFRIVSGTIGLVAFWLVMAFLMTTIPP
jgi:hypothetical protein